jgi:hypothetical protein
VRWENRQVKKVIAPAEVRKEEVYHSLSHQHRLMTLLVWISAVGNALTAMPITFSPIRDSLWSHSPRQDDDVMVCRRSPAYINEDLFFEYISNVLIPSVTTVRSCPELESETAILLMDSALPHLSARVIQILG